jgi:outer membrane protein assembly factor BamB
MCCLRCGIVAVLSALGIAGCNSRPEALPATDVPFVGDLGREAVGAGDDWTTFARDYRRSGFEASLTPFSPATVSKLRLRWRKYLGGEISASPLAYAGNIIVVTRGISKFTTAGSFVYDFRAKDGRELWRFAMGAEGKMTPTIDPVAGLVIVGNVQRNRTDSSYLFALRLLDGSVAWRQQIHGTLHATPIVVGGRVYVGRAGADPPECLQGGITALDESTGKIEWNWNVDPHPHEGGSVWGAIAYDGAHLIFGTGNTCQGLVPTANGAVSLGLDGKPVWSIVAVKNSYYDSDTGSGVMLFGGRAHFLNKNGRLYAVDQETGKLEWTTDLNPSAGPPSWLGGFATPSTDGSTIVEGSGLYKNGNSAVSGDYCLLSDVKPDESFTGLYSKLQGMDMSGRILWTRSMQNRLVGYVALANHIGFVGLNQDFVAFDVSTGRTLWSYHVPYYIDASVVVVPSGVYAADDGGNVYAFALPSEK